MIPHVDSLQEVSVLQFCANLIKIRWVFSVMKLADMTSALCVLRTFAKRAQEGPVTEDYQEQRLPEPQLIIRI
jgi:hypothetical protein